MECIQGKVHSRTIIHIDIDSFYAQVELFNQPHLLNEPVGVKQKNIVVTCNYVARKYGVQKCMLVSEALEICPQLFLFNGEDLYKYRQASRQIHTFLLSFTDKVEKSGFDENYLDVTDLIEKNQFEGKYSEEISGHCIGQLGTNCRCGCHQRLCIGSQIANEIRKQLKDNLGFTSSCGISYNKLLSKLSCSAHKPNEQTTLLPNGTLKFLQSLKCVSKLPGVGVKCTKLLESINVRMVKELQTADLNKLEKVLKSEASAIRVKNLSLGICDAVIKPSGKQNLLSVEDGFKKISIQSDVKEKFKMLLQRLLILVKEDGRVPNTVKVTVRKYDSIKKSSKRETKQSPVQACLFGYPVRKLTEESTKKLLNIIMCLFCKIVDVSKPFHVTLLGLAFSKFHEIVNAGSIASFLLKKRDLAVHSLTSFISSEHLAEVENKTLPASSESESDSEVEPSPKKPKFDVNANVNSPKTEDAQMFSPSKLKVEDLKINENIDFINKYSVDVDPKVFQELPLDMQNEIIEEWRIKCAKPMSENRSKQTLINFYFVPKNKT